MNKTLVGTFSVLLILAFALAVDFVVVVNADKLGTLISLFTIGLTLMNVFLFYFAYSLAMKTIDLTE